MKRILKSPWFQLVNLLLAFTSGVICYVWPQTGGWPLLVALLPWAARVVAGRFPFQRTVLDLPLALFLLTAGIGVWTAYSREVALSKLWVIVAAVLLYYAVCSLSMRNAWFLSGLLGLVGVAIGLFFFVTHDWHSQPAYLRSLNLLTLKWMLVRPELDLGAIDHNRAGGLLAMCLPFPIALAGQAWREKKNILALGAFGTGLVILFFLLSTSSRGALIALIFGFGLWFLWEASGWIGRSVRKPGVGVFLLLLLIMVGIPLLLLLRGPAGGSLPLFERISGIPPLGNRLPLFIDTFHLIDDFSILGGGLGSFPGLYSQYIKLLPFLYIGYSHNFYLDVLLEQGIFGFFSIAIIFLGSVWLVINHLRRIHPSDGSYLLNWAVLVGLIIVILHGFMDDPLFGERGTTLLFLLSGLGIATTQSGRVMDESRAPALLNRGLIGSLKFGWNTALLGFSLTAILLVLAFGGTRPFLAELYANIGAVKMAQAELVAWPTRKWTEDTDISTLQDAQQWFERSLALDPMNETSHYRLGLIAMRAQDFQHSGAHLETAHASDLDHPGLRKSLGYSYLWSGQLASGAQLLKKIPESDHELLVYIGWWKNHGKMDLSKRAVSATLLLRMIRIVDQESISK